MMLKNGIKCLMVLALTNGAWSEPAKEKVEDAESLRGVARRDLSPRRLIQKLNYEAQTKGDLEKLIQATTTLEKNRGIPDGINPMKATSMVQDPNNNCMYVGYPYANVVHQYNLGEPGRDVLRVIEGFEPDGFFGASLVHWEDKMLAVSASEKVFIYKVIDLVGTDEEPNPVASIELSEGKKIVTIMKYCGSDHDLAVEAVDGYGVKDVYLYKLRDI